MPRKAGSLCRFKCLCGTVELTTGGSHHFRCAACRAAGIRVRRLCGCYVTGKDEAALRVAYAIRDGVLPSPRGMRCADCAGPAVEYEHRDYNKPLSVEPICRRCNLRRGPAVPRHGSIDVLLARGLVPYTRKRIAEQLLRVMGRRTDVLEGLPNRLCLADWRRIWPELIAAPGAPAPAEPEEAPHAA